MDVFYIFILYYQNTLILEGVQLERSLKMKKTFILLLLAVTIGSILIACGNQGEIIEETTEHEILEEREEAIEEVTEVELAVEEELVPEGGSIILATTTSTEDSGLLSFLLPYFTEETGWEVQVVSVGTGAALQIGRDGDADVLLVHARALEDQFVADGYAQRRYDIMYNDFVVVGPQDGVISHSSDIEATFIAILYESLNFISRGDESGTHVRELEIWEALGLDPWNNSNYFEVGDGMGATLGMAIELNAYTLSDRATWLNRPDQGELVIVCEGSSLLLNPYGIMIVSSTEEPEGSRIFVDWMLSNRGQSLIGSFGVAEFGSPLFFPEAN
jgi:tungstate transport system substrate-binding protein